MAAKVLSFAALTGVLTSTASAQRVAVTLKNGMIISPVRGRVIQSVSNKAKVGSGQHAAKIAEMDDGLRLTLVDNGLVQGEVPVPPQSTIEFPANARLVASPDNSRSVTAFTAASTVYPFSVLGRRFYRFDTGIPGILSCKHHGDYASVYKIRKLARRHGRPRLGYENVIRCHSTQNAI